MDLLMLACMPGMYREQCRHSCRWQYSSRRSPAQTTLGACFCGNLQLPFGAALFNAINGGHHMHQSIGDFDVCWCLRKPLNASSYDPIPACWRPPIGDDPSRAYLQMVLNELPSAQVVVIATPELTRAALDRLEADQEYTHLLLKGNLKLQVTTARSLETCLCTLCSCCLQGFTQLRAPGEHMLRCKQSHHSSFSAAAAMASLLVTQSICTNCFCWRQRVRSYPLNTFAPNALHVTPRKCLLVMSAIGSKISFHMSPVVWFQLNYNSLGICGWDHPQRMFKTLRQMFHLIHFENVTAYYWLSSLLSFSAELTSACLQILNSLQQMPRVKLLQNAALLRTEGALLVWGKTTAEVSEKLEELEEQIAEAVTAAKVAGHDTAQTAVATVKRTINYTTPVSTFVALAGCGTIVALQVSDACCA